jgi:hypothetical protein
MAIVAPWFGWSLAHATHDKPGGYAASNILTGFSASEKLIVVSRNLLSILTSPSSLLTGLNNVLLVVGTILILVWCFFRRRQLVPDLFVALYCLMLLGITWPPERSAAPILPLVLWILWRVVRLMKNREALAALVVVVAVLPLWADVTRIPAARARGYFQIVALSADNRDEMRKLFGFIRANTEPDSVLLANRDGLFFLNTGRKAVRGFTPNGFDIFYAARQSAVTPDQLSGAIAQAHVNYVVLTPDRGLPESASFHRSVEALERGGVVEPVSIPGIGRDYRLLKVIAR